MKKNSVSLSDAEWRIMQSRWRGERAMSVRDIMEEVNEESWSVHSVRVVHRKDADLKLLPIPYQIQFVVHTHLQ